jgi:hypothetical protein
LLLEVVVVLFLVVGIMLQLLQVGMVLHQVLEARVHLPQHVVVAVAVFIHLVVTMQLIRLVEGKVFVKEELVGFIQVTNLVVLVVALVLIMLALVILEVELVVVIAVVVA